MSIADVPEEWPQWVAQIRAALPMWDAWCPDDGRPAYALHMLEQYTAGQSSVEELTRAEDRLVSAGYGCAHAGGLAGYHADGAPRVLIPHVNRAWRMTWALLLLIQAVRWPGSETYHWDLARHGMAHLQDVTPCP